MRLVYADPPYPRGPRRGLMTDEEADPDASALLALFAKQMETLGKRLPGDEPERMDNGLMLYVGSLIDDDDSYLDEARERRDEAARRETR